MFLLHKKSDIQLGVADYVIGDAFFMRRRDVLEWFDYDLGRRRR
jgi:hypothetical protein